MSWSICAVLYVLDTVALRWSTGGRATESARAVVRQLELIEARGLDKADYDASRLRALVTRESLPPQAQADLDVTLSTACLWALRALPDSVRYDSLLVAGVRRLQRWHRREQNLVAQQSQLEQVDLLVKAGRRSIADQYQQRAAVATAQSGVVTAKRAVELAKVDVIQTLQLEPGTTYDFAAPTVDSAVAPPRFALDGLLASAFSDRADLKAAQSRVDAASEALKTSGSTRWPPLALNLGYSSGDTSLTDESFSTQLNPRKGGSVGVSLSVPIFDRGAAKVATQQRYRVGAATLVELSVARAAQVSAASALVNARYTLIFQQSLMSNYTGTLDPARGSFGRARCSTVVKPRTHHQRGGGETAYHGGTGAQRRGGFGVKMALTGLASA